jgi:hypothetical protein
MSENEILVAEQAAENVEQTTEESPKTYTQEEFDTAVNSKVDEVLGKKIARKEAKIRKEYERQYGGLVDTLKAGTGKESVEEITNTFADFYRNKGITIPDKPKYSDKDIEVLARADAEDIIRAGYDEVVEEVDRLAALGASNMTARDKVLFKALAEYRQNAERSRDLSEIGVTEDVYNSKEFTEFASMFNPNTPIKKVYETYAKTLPKKDIKPMGSMKNNDSGDNGVKEFYTVDEARRFTKADYDKNPALFKAVCNSMTKWKK